MITDSDKSSTSSSNVHASVVCHICGNTFTKRGINIHIARSHASSEESTINISDETEVDTSHKIDTKLPAIEESTSESSCPECGLCFSTARGLIIHKSKRHASSANKDKVNKLLKTTKENLADIPNATTCEQFSNPEVQNELNRWFKTFQDIKSNIDVFKHSEFNDRINDFLIFLYEVNSALPGPQHPATRYYRMRKKQKNGLCHRSSSNPQRSSTKRRERNRARYEYEVAQFNYHNRRKAVVRTIMNSNNPQKCPIHLNEIESNFHTLFGSANENIREQYAMNNPRKNISEVSISSVKQAIKRMSLDSSPGPDRVLVRTVKELGISGIIQLIINIMLSTSYVPEKLKQGRTILIYKGKGDMGNMSSWRPITIYSVLRRIIERVLDKELRMQLQLNHNQRGFVSNLAGCHVNAKLIDSCLQDAKMKKRSCVMTFLDVSRAFDRVGHSHIGKSLAAQGISSDLQQLIISLLQDNTVQVEVGSQRSKKIPIRCGVPQGGPLSPTLFNLAIDFIYNEICDPIFASEYGYTLEKDIEPLCLTGFADDQVVTARNIDGAVRVTDTVTNLLLSIGLEINAEKCNAIVIQEGQLVQSHIQLSSGEIIQSIAKTENIKYLGCTFSDQLIFNKDALKPFNEDLEKLSKSPLLKPNQKLNIINQYIFPSLIYPLQTAPLIKIPSYILEGLDVIIRRTVKEIIGLPDRTASAMLYSPRNLRGLGLVNCKWEAPLQHISIAQKLSKYEDPRFTKAFDYDHEIQASLASLNISKELFETYSCPRKIRKHLRQLSFEDWSSMSWQGIGVSHFAEYPPANNFMNDTIHLTSSEWTSLMKLNVNYANLRGVPGNNGGKNGTSLCRRCAKERETPSHVLGQCPFNSLLINRRHHKVKHAITNFLQTKGFQCYEEVHAVDEDGANRFIDIVAFNKDSKEAHLIDPTVRYETNNPDQARNVDCEKKAIYESCIPFLKEKYSPRYSGYNFAVQGLLFGARGTIYKEVKQFCNTFGIDQRKLCSIIENIICDSIAIIHHHVYKNND